MFQFQTGTGHSGRFTLINILNNILLMQMIVILKNCTGPIQTLQCLLTYFLWYINVCTKLLQNFQNLIVL
jgi:hypothetical protein